MNRLPVSPVTARLPPPLPRPHDFLGAVALAFGVLCAGVTASAVSLWRDIGQYRAGLPAHFAEGATGFSLHGIPWLLTFCALVLGIITLILLAGSCVVRHRARQPQATFLHLGTLAALLPLLYVLLRFAEACLLPRGA